MPSLHFAGALFTAWGLWSLGTTWRLLGLGVAILTVLATLGTGQHYAIDLIVAVPFATAVYAGASRTGPWKAMTVYGIVGTLAWIALLRWAPGQLVHVNGVTWLLALTTIAIPIALLMRLGVAKQPLLDPRAHDLFETRAPRHT
jgi:hypothetical protein